MSTYDALLRRFSIWIAVTMPIFPVFFAGMHIFPPESGYILHRFFPHPFFELLVIWLIALSLLFQFRVFCAYSGLNPGQIWRPVAFLHGIFIVPTVILGPLSYVLWIHIFVPFIVFFLTLLFAFGLSIDPKPLARLDVLEIGDNRSRKVALFFLLVTPGFISNGLTLFLLIAIFWGV